MLQIVEYVFFVSLVVFAGFYVFYYLVCFYFKSKPKNKINALLTDDADPPKVSLVVPVFNENKILEKKIQNLQELDYPRSRFEIIFVDGGSTDGSIDTMKNAIGRVNLDIKLVEQGRRMGFNKAVIDGFYASTGDIICIPGAETMYASDALRRLVRPFLNERVGAVNGRQIIENLDEGLSPKLEHAYRHAQDFLREGEDNMDTLFDVKGEIVAGRRKIVEELVNNIEFGSKGCIDACFFFQARRDGYSTVYNSNAVYYEFSPRSFRASFKQRYRRAATLIQNMLIFKNMILNRKYGLFGMLIMPAHFLMLIILPYLFFSGLISFLILQVVYFPNFVYFYRSCIGRSGTSLFQDFPDFLSASISSHNVASENVKRCRNAEI